MLMTQGQQFSIFWQQAGHLEIHCSYQHYQRGKITLQLPVLMIELVLVATSYELSMMQNVLHLWL